MHLFEGILWGHFIANIVSSFCFFYISNVFTRLVNRIKLGVRREIKDGSKVTIFITMNRYSHVLNLMAAVFFFCGLGHLVDSFHSKLFNIVESEIVHTITASLSCFLVYILHNSLSSSVKE